MEKTFAKFKQGAVKDYRVGFRAVADMDYVEAQVLDLVGKLYPETFAALDDFCARRANYVDDTLGAFDREVQFYLAYLDYIRPLKAVGLDFPASGSSSSPTSLTWRTASTPKRRIRRCSCGPSGATTGSGHSGCLRASPCRPATGQTSTGRYSAPSQKPPRPARGRARNHPRDGKGRWSR